MTLNTFQQYKKLVRSQRKEQDLYNQLRREFWAEMVKPKPKWLPLGIYWFLLGLFINLPRYAKRKLPTK